MLKNFKQCALLEEVGDFRGFRVFDFGPYTKIENSEKSEKFTTLKFQVMCFTWGSWRFPIFDFRESKIQKTRKFCVKRICFIWGSWKFLRSEAVTRSVLYKKVFLKSFTNFTGKHLCWKTPGLRNATLLKSKLQHRCFPVKFEKFLRTTFLKSTSGQMLL